MKKTNMSKSKELLIIDVQKSAVDNSSLLAKAEKPQQAYNFVCTSYFINKKSPLSIQFNLDIHQNTPLTFVQKKRGGLFNKNIYSSFLTQMNRFKEICGFDTNACIDKTKTDLFEYGIRPVILKDFCGTQTKKLQEFVLLSTRQHIGKNNIKQQKGI